jgi:hypothetical protein
VTCTAEDAVENQSSDSFTITVVSPFGYIPDFVILGEEWVRLGSGVAVESGNVGAFEESTGVPNAAGFEVVTGSSSILGGGSQAAAHSDRLGSFSSSGDVFYVDTIDPGSGATYTPRIGYVPLFYSMPAVPSAGPGGPNMSFSGVANVLGAGNYGKLTLSSNAQLRLTGGTYSFSGIELKNGSALAFESAATVVVSGRVLVGNGATVGPTAGSGIEPRDVVLTALGTDGPAKKPGDAFTIGGMATVNADAYAPFGTISIGSFTQATGAFIGRWVVVADNVTLALSSSFLCP